MPTESNKPMIHVRPAAKVDCDLILFFIIELTVYEKREHEVVATVEVLEETLFSPKPYAQVLIAELGGQAVGYALFFYSFSTFLGRPGIYLEDIYVTPAKRGHGVGRAVMSHIARLAVEHKCYRFEWSVLDWNESSIQFYHSIGAVSMDGWTAQRLTGLALLDLAVMAKEGARGE